MAPSRESSHRGSYTTTRASRSGGHRSELHHEDAVLVPDQQGNPNTYDNVEINKWTPLDELQGRVHGLISEDRVHFVAPADYSEHEQLEVTVKGILGRYARAL